MQNHALLNISWQPLHDYDVNISTFTVYEEPEHEKTNERTNSKNSTPEKFANIWQIERNGIGEKKFKAARIHFLSNVFVAVVDA